MRELRSTSSALTSRLPKACGASEVREKVRLAFDGGGGDLGAVGEGKVDALGRETPVERGFHPSDAAFDAGVREQVFDAASERLRLELGFDPEEGGADGDDEEGNAPKAATEETRHRDDPAILSGSFARATKSPVELLPPGLVIGCRRAV